MPRKTPRARASNLGGRGGRGTTNKRIRKRIVAGKISRREARRLVNKSFSKKEREDAAKKIGFSTDKEGNVIQADWGDRIIQKRMEKAAMRPIKRKRKPQKRSRK